MRGISYKILPWFLLLSACQTATPGIKVEYVDRPVITETKCVKVGDIPVLPKRLGTAPSNLETALAVSLAKVSEWMRYGNKTDAILKSCSAE